MSVISFWKWWLVFCWKQNIVMLLLVLLQLRLRWNCVVCLILMGQTDFKRFANDSGDKQQCLKRQKIVILKLLFKTSYWETSKCIYFGFSSWISKFHFFPQRPCYVSLSMKSQFEFWQGIVLLSQAGKTLYSRGWQSPRDDVSIKILNLC